MSVRSPRRTKAIPEGALRGYDESQMPRRTRPLNQSTVQRNCRMTYVCAVTQIVTVHRPYSQMPRPTRPLGKLYACAPVFYTWKYSKFVQHTLNERPYNRTHTTQTPSLFTLRVRSVYGHSAVSVHKSTLKTCNGPRDFFVKSLDIVFHVCKKLPPTLTLDTPVI